MTDAEVNRIVAEKLYGWDVIEDRFLEMHQREGAGIMIGRPPGRGTTERVKKYCSSPDLCIGPGGIVEKMMERLLTLTLHSMPGHCSGCFSSIHSSKLGPFVDGTACQVIAHAAAVALQAEEGKA